MQFPSSRPTLVAPSGNRYTMPCTHKTHQQMALIFHVLSDGPTWKNMEKNIGAFLTNKMQTTKKSQLNDAWDNPLIGSYLVYFSSISDLFFWSIFGTSQLNFKAKKCLKISQHKKTFSTQLRVKHFSGSQKVFVGRFSRFSWGLFQISTF